MTKNDFFFYLNFNGSSLTFDQEFEIDEEISITENKNFIFNKKVIFHKSVTFQGVNIEFRDVEFKDKVTINSQTKITINHCIAKSITLNKNDIELHILGGTINLLQFSNSNLKKCVIENVELNRFEAYRSVFSEIFIIGNKNKKVKINNIRIIEGKIMSLNLSHLEIGNKVDYSDLIIDESSCFVSSATINNLNIEDSNFNHKSEFNGTIIRINFIEKVHFDELNFNGEISNVDLKNNLTIQCLKLDRIIGKLKFNENSKIDECIVNCTITEDFEINNGWIKHLKFEEAAFADKIYISGGKIDEILIGSKGLKILRIKPNKIIKIQKILQTVFVEHLIENEKDLLKIGKIEFSNYNVQKDKESKYIGLSINELKFSNFSNYGNIVFSNLRPWQKTKAKVTIENSDLGKMLFMDCDFTEFQMQFTSSKISEIFLAGTNMPNNENINASKTFKSNHDQKRLALTQIKKIYENRGDLFNATRYHEAELMDWLEEIKTEKNKCKEKKLIYSQLKKMYEVRGDSINVVKYHGLELDMQREMIKGHKGSFWERFQLCLNKRSNNFGQSWQWALGYLLFINLVFYSLYLWSLGLLFQNTSIDYNLFGYYFEFLNPTHKIDFLKNGIGLINIKINGLAVLIDFVNRIFIGFLIYQLISAFRKYGKK